MPTPNVITTEEHFWTPELSGAGHRQAGAPERLSEDRKSTRLNSSH